MSTVLEAQREGEVLSAAKADAAAAETVPSTFQETGTNRAWDVRAEID